MATLPNLAWNHSSVLRSSPCVIIPGGYKENNVVFEPVISFHRFFTISSSSCSLEKKKKTEGGNLKCHAGQCWKWRWLWQEATRKHLGPLANTYACIYFIVHMYVSMRVYTLCTESECVYVSVYVSLLLSSSVVFAAVAPALAFIIQTASFTLCLSPSLCFSFAVTCWLFLAGLIGWGSGSCYCCFCCCLYTDI